MKRRLQLIEAQLVSKRKQLEKLRQRSPSVNNMMYKEKIKELTESEPAESS